MPLEKIEACDPSKVITLGVSADHIRQNLGRLESKNRFLAEVELPEQFVAKKTLEHLKDTGVVVSQGAGWIVHLDLLGTSEVTEAAVAGSFIASGCVCILLHEPMMLISKPTHE